MIVYVVSNTGKLLGINYHYKYILHITSKIQIPMFNMKENIIPIFIITVKLSLHLNYRCYSYYEWCIKLPIYIDAIRCLKS